MRRPADGCREGMTLIGCIASLLCTLSNWAAAHNLTPTGPMWDVYLTDPEQEPHAAHWQTDDVFVYVVRSPVTGTAGSSD